MSEIAVTLPDGSSRRVRAGSTARDVAAEVSPGLAKAALAATVDGRLVDLTYPLEQNAKVAIVTDRNAEALALFRHSTAHLLAAAVTLYSLVSSQLHLSDPTALQAAGPVATHLASLSR